MSKRLEELFEIYMDLKNSKETKFSISNGEVPVFNIELIKTNQIQHKYELGEIFFVDDFLFLLTSEDEKNYFGYKVTEWVDFATNEDFVFNFNDTSYMAITTDLVIPKNKVNKFVGKLSEEQTDILYEFVVNDEPFPSKYSGLTIPLHDLTYVQNQFRMKELSEVAQYCFAIFFDEEAEEETKIYDFNEMKNLLKNQIKDTKMPMAAADDKSTAMGENFYLHLNKDKNLLSIIINDENIVKNKVAKLIYFNKEYIFEIKNNTIEIEVDSKNINLSLIKENIKITNA
jgi:hypothetical protein